MNKEIRIGTIGMDPGDENGLTIGNSEHGTADLSISSEAPEYLLMN